MMPKSARFGEICAWLSSRADVGPLLAGEVLEPFEGDVAPLRKPGRRGGVLARTDDLRAVPDAVSASKVHSPLRRSS